MRSLEDLLEPFTRATEEGRLAWEPDDGNPPGTERYVAKLPRHQARIWQWLDQNDGSVSVTAQLENRSGEVLDAVSADEYSQKFAALDKLYTLARRSAHNVSLIIDEVERELAALRPVRA